VGRGSRPVDRLARQEPGTLIVDLEGLGVPAEKGERKHKREKATTQSRRGEKGDET